MVSKKSALAPPPLACRSQGGGLEREFLKKKLEAPWPSRMLGRHVDNYKIVSKPT